MNSRKTLANDPKLTAYALGELDGFERATVEAALRDDPAARAAVEEIRGLGAQLEGAFASEAAADHAAEKPAASLRATSIPGRDLSKLDGGPLNGPPSLLAKMVRFPQFYYVAAGLAAACFALMVALRTPKPPRAPQAAYAKIDLAPLPTSLPQGESSAVATETDRAVDAAVPATVVVNLASAESATQAVPLTPGPLSSGNLTLLGQAKDLVAGKLNNVASFGPAFSPRPSQSLKKETLGNLAARSEPLAITSGSGPGAVRMGEAVSLNVATKVGEKRAEARVQMVGATHTYPSDEKMLVDARTKAAVKVAPTHPASPSLFEQAVKQGPGALRFSAGSVLSSTGTSTFGSEGRFTLGASGGGAVVTNSRDGIIVSENRGRLGYVATDLDRVAPASTDRYAEIRDNDFLGVAQNPLSTFSIDVDTASYSNVRNFLRNHQRPPRDAVRVEELVNYFSYRYPPPTGAVPFAASLEVAEAPWAPTHRLVRIGLKGREVTTAARPGANLVFLLDVSGSMNVPNRLPLVKESMRLLVGKLRPDDRVAIVTYAGQSGLALASTPVSQGKEILGALDQLEAGGSTNGAMGIQLAYDVAKANFVPNGINRVILCTDGDFNVGVTGEGDLTRLIEEKAKSGVALTALGFGMGNLKDATLEQLADRGNGNYGYIDSRREAEKLLVEQVNGTLVTIAKDVKIQVEFNPARVASYRLLGYENRLLKKEDFNNDAVDAGEIGAGQTVTAFYEIVPAGGEGKSGPMVAPVDELKYARVENQKSKIENRKSSDELLTVKLRYKEPAGDVSKRVEFPLTDSGAAFAHASTDFKFAAAVAGFGMILRDSPHKGTATLADVVAWAESGSTDDAGGYRSEFIDLAHDAARLVR